MGCINRSPVVIICSMESFKKETKKKLARKKSENPGDKDFSFSYEIEDDTSHCSKQSQIPIKAKMVDNVLIFL